MKMTFPKICFFLLIVFAIPGLQAQNLVPNPDFEAFSACPTGPGDLTAIGWTSPTGGTPDYFHGCYNGGPMNNVGIPLNYVGWHQPLSGHAYVGFEAHNTTGTKEYIQTVLTEPLVAGECYEVEIFTSPAYGAFSNLAINHVGVYLSATAPTVGLDGNFFLEAQVYYPDVVTDVDNWVALTGTYQANGGEQYITIGNFSPTGYYNVETLGPQFGSVKSAYYYIENVRVEATQEPGELYELVVLCPGECFQYAGNLYCDEGNHQIPINQTCYDVLNLTIYHKQSTIAVIEEPEILTCEVLSVVLDASGSSSGEGLGFSYEWEGPNNFESNAQSPVVSEPGVYTLTVNGSGIWCPTSVSIEVFENLVPPEITAEASGGIGCINYPVTLTGTSNNPNVTYNWNGPGVNVNAPIAVTNQEGTYTFTVTTFGGACTSTESVTIFSDFETPDVSAQSVGVIDCNNWIASLFGSSTTPNVTYQWAGPGANANTPNTLTAVPGIHTLIVTAPNGCTSSVDVDVPSDLEPPDISAEVIGNLDCENETVTLSGSSETSGITFNWSGPGVDTNLLVVVANQVGIYTLTLTGPNGCTSTAEVEVVQESTAMEIEAVVDGILDCENTTVTLTGNSNTPNAIYQWSGPGLLADTSIIEVSEPGEYIFSASNGNGCMADTTILVEQNIATPQIVFNDPDVLDCNTLSVNLDASSSSGMGILDYEWQNENGDVLGNAAVLNVSVSGIYTLILTDDATGCSELSSIEVFGNSEEPVSIAEAEGMLDCQNNSVILDGSNSTGDPLTFQWLDENDVVISNDTSLDVSTAGIYTLLVSNTVSGCTDVSTIEVEINTDSPIAIAETDDLLDCNNIEATLDGNGSSQGLNFSYEWQNPSGDFISNGLQVLVSEPGIYTLIVFNNENGCSSSASVEIEQDIEAPVAVAGNDELITCNQSVLTLDGSASGSSSGVLAFQWTNPNNQIISNSATVDVGMAGIYTLTVIAENGCSASDEVEVVLDTNVPVADVGAGGILNCDVSIITLGGSGSSSGNNITYQWQDENNQVIATAAMTDVALPGTYTLIVTDNSNNCSTSASIEIPQDIQSPIADTGDNATLNCLLTEITLDGSQSSSGPEFNYQWQNSNNVVISNDISVLTNQPDTYTLIVTNSENNCTAESTVVIDQNIDTPVADAGNDGVLTCDVNEISLDGSSSSGNNLSFEWFNGSGISIGNQAVIQVSEPGIYSLLVTDTQSGCTTQSDAEVIGNENLPTAIATADDILTCEINQVTIDGSASTSVSGNISFEWLDEGGNVISILENAHVSIPGLYTLIVTDTDNGCSTSTTVVVDQDIEAPVAEAGNNQTLICGQTSLTLDAGGSSGQNLSFEWLDDNGTIIATTAATTVLSVGIYTVFVTNTQNGCSDSDSVEIIPDIDLPTADAGNTGTLTCDLTQILLDGTASSSGPNIEYEWQNSSGDVIATSQTTIISEPGTYTLFVLDTENDCIAQDDVVISQNIDPPTAQIGFVAGQEINCYNSSLVLDGNGSSPFGILDFQWSTDDGAILSGENTPNPEMGQAGTYTLTVTNTVNGCTDDEIIEIVENLESPTAIINPPQTLTCTVEEIQIDASASSSNGNFVYSWTSNPAGGITSGGSTLLPTASQAGTYTLTILDEDNGCQSTAQVTVLENTTPPVAVANTDEQFDCITESVALDGSGSSVGPQFIYQWTGNGPIDNETGLSPTVYTAGNYTLQVTNTENGCTQMAAILVEENDNIPTDADVVADDLDCFGNLGSLTIFSVTGGQEPYLYSIDGGQNFSSVNIFTSLEAGNYTLLIQDAIGCEYEESVSIQPATELFVEVQTEVTLQLGEDFQINAITNIPVSEIDTIIWSPDTNLSCTNCLNPGIENIIEQIEYTVTIIDENGCQATDQILLRLDKTREVFIPNAFSPNDDGTNDHFMIFADNDKIKQVNTFRIFDRWGEMVFEANDFQPNVPGHGWDGSLNGEKLNPAVFVYFAEIEFIDGVKQVYKGDVALMK